MVFQMKKKHQMSSLFVINTVAHLCHLQQDLNLIYIQKTREMGFRILNHKMITHIYNCWVTPKRNDNKKLGARCHSKRSCFRVSYMWALKVKIKLSFCWWESQYPKWLSKMSKLTDSGTQGSWFLVSHSQKQNHFWRPLHENMPIKRRLESRQWHK